MASGPDLFVVCKSCGSEVSPYITECPYCGNRLRKRAPKLEKGGTLKPPKAPRRRPQAPSLGKLRPGEIPGIRADLSLRPYATMVLVLAAALFTVGGRAGIYDLYGLALTEPVTDDLWRLLTTSFAYLGTGYELVALVAIGLFGWLLERRHGLWAPLLVYVLGALVGSAAELAVEPEPFAVGGNAAALALLAAWSVPGLLARRRDRDGSELDLYGLAAFALVLLALPLATAEASPWAGIGGALTGGLLGLVLARAVRR